MESKKKQKRYRLSLVNDLTHESLYTIRFNKVNFFSLLILSLCVIIGFVYCILVFTPLKYSIPGYPGANFRRQAIQNAIKIDSLESAMVRWELYAQNINRTLAGEQTLSLENVVKSNGRTDYLEAKNDLYLQKRDSLLRARVNAEEQFGLSSGQHRNLPIQGMHFFTPLKGRITNGYNVATHPAIDIAAPKNTSVKAALDGTVIYAGWSTEYGYTISIQHEGNIVSTYKHNKNLLKKQGDKVEAGTPIAYIGNTGSTSFGDHLHFELWYNGQAVDPTLYIAF